MITKLNENGNSGIDGGEVTLNDAEASKLIVSGLLEMEIVCGPGNTGMPDISVGIGTPIMSIKPPVTVSESTSLLSKNTQTLVCVKPLPVIVVVLLTGPLSGVSVIDAAKTWGTENDVTNTRTANIGIL